MTKEGKVSSISKEEVSLSKCMAYSGRRDGLFNSHIWEYINLCVHTHIIYIPPSCGLDVNPQTKNIEKEKVDFESAKVFCLSLVFSFLYTIMFSFVCLVPLFLCLLPLRTIHLYNQSIRVWHYLSLCLSFSSLLLVLVSTDPLLPPGTIPLYNVHTIHQSLAVLTIYHKPSDYYAAAGQTLKVIRKHSVWRRDSVNSLSWLNNTNKNKIHVTIILYLSIEINRGKSTMDHLLIKQLQWFQKHDFKNF